jgi:hypothetical protein
LPAASFLVEEKPGANWMRALLLIAGAVMALSGCSRGAQNDNNLAASDSLTTQNIVSNDVTAIDAVTGDAANMAADVDMNFGNLNEVGGNGGGTVPSRARRPAAETPANAASNAPSNTSTPAASATNAE